MNAESRGVILHGNLHHGSEPFYLVGNAELTPNERPGSTGK
jgi:hypothetical protein